jgi:sulfur carrier protein
MTVVVNGEAQALDDGTSVAALVAAMGRGPKGVAVAVNGEVVPRSTWEARRLAADDQVEVLTAAQGG